MVNTHKILTTNFMTKHLKAIELKYESQISLAQNDQYAKFSDLPYDNTQILAICYLVDISEKYKHNYLIYLFKVKMTF